MNNIPFPILYRHLWQPEAINATVLPNFRGDITALSLTGAAKRTTCDGVHFNGVATSNINFGAIHNGQAKLALSLRFKLDNAYGIGSGNQYLFGKYIDADNYIYLYLSTADGLLHLIYRSAAVNLFDISVGTGSFSALTWYHVYFATGQAIVGGAASDGARLRLDNGVAATNANATALPAGGDFIIGDYDDPGVATGFRGIITDIFVYTDDVTSTEETENYQGQNNLDAVHLWALDEGRGTTANDTGSGANNGTLDTSAVWAWDQVRQPVISLDGRNDYTESVSDNIDVTGAVTFVWVMKNKISPAFTTTQYLAVLTDSVSGDMLAFRRVTGIDLYGAGSGASKNIGPITFYAIDSYLIFLGTHSGGTIKMYVNGSLVGSVAGVGVLRGGANTWRGYLNRTAGTTYYHQNRTLLLGLIDGAFTDRQALIYSKWIRDRFNLPITI